MQPHKIVSRDEWLAARKAHLADEKAFTRARDELSRKRRDLPWEKVDKTLCVRRTGRQGNARQSVRRQEPADRLSLHARSGLGSRLPELLAVWPIISTARSFHLAQRDVSFVVISRAPLEEIEVFKRRMGWRFKWVSSFGNDFNFDYHVSFTPEQKASGAIEYNYEKTEFPSEEAPGASVFYKDTAGDVFHTYSSYGRGLDILIGAYNFLDLAPKGRDEEGLAWSMAWVRHHDRYDGAAVDSTATYIEPKTTSCCD